MKETQQRIKQVLNHQVPLGPFLRLRTKKSSHMEDALEAKASESNSFHAHHVRQNYEPKKQWCGSIKQTVKGTGDI